MQINYVISQNSNTWATEPRFLCVEDKEVISRLEFRHVLVPFVLWNKFNLWGLGAETDISIGGYGRGTRWRIAAGVTSCFRADHVTRGFAETMVVLPRADYVDWLSAVFEIAVRIDHCNRLPILLLLLLVHMFGDVKLAVVLDVLHERVEDGTNSRSDVRTDPV